MQSLRTACWYAYGRKRFARPGYLEAAKTFDASDLDESRVRGRKYVVTGGNAGLGRSVVESLAQRGAIVYMVCRSRERGETAREEIRKLTTNENVHLLVGDVSSGADVQRVVKEWCERERENPVLDALVCNAGVMVPRRETTSEGFETTFATNLLFGTYLITKLFLPFLQRAADPRVVVVSSGGMYIEPLDNSNLQSEKAEPYDGVRAYAHTKRMQVVLAEWWASSYPLSSTSRVRFVSCHPGWSRTPGVQSSMPSFDSFMGDDMRSVEEGADGISWLTAVAGDRLQNGAFYLDRVVERKHLMFCRTEPSAAQVDTFVQTLAQLSAPFCTLPSSSPSA